MDNNPSETTELSTDVEASVDIAPMVSATVAESNTNQMTHNLEGILERYVVVDSFDWSSDDPQVPIHLSQASFLSGDGAFLKQYVLPQAILENSSIVREKLNNFLLMKCDVEIDVKVNATPFQQGALMIAYFPRSLQTSRFRALGSEFLASISSAPHRVLNLEQANVMTFRIPYANIVDYINLTNPDDIFGTVNIYPLVALSTDSDSTSCGVTVRMRLVDVKLEVPTDNSLFNNTRYQHIELDCMKARMAYAPRQHCVKCEMMEGEKQGPVTRIAGTISSIAGALGSVPLIGAAAQTISWTARLAAGVATVFGWSKPTDLIMAGPIVNRPAQYMGNTEGKDSSCVLAQIPDNAITTEGAVPETVDEMSHGFIFQRPNFVGRFTVPKSNFRNKRLLFAWEVAPFNVLCQQTASNGADFSLGSFSFTALMYKLWRGGLHYSLSCVKTQYHSARLVAVYFPNRQVNDIPDTYDELLTSNSNLIYDLAAKTDEEFSLSKPLIVPYTSEEPWKRTLYLDPGTNTYTANSLKTNIGCVAIYCLNDLVAPDMVSDAVTFLLQVQGAEDFEVAIPQIQLQAGFATAILPPVDINERAAALITSLYSNVTYDISTNVRADWTDGTSGEPLLTQSGLLTSTWDGLLGSIVTLPDGDYSATVDLSFSASNYQSVPSYLLQFTVDTGIVATATGQHIDASATGSTTTVTVTATPTEAKEKYTHYDSYRSEMDNGVEATPTGDLITPLTPSRKIALSTTGEYSSSLRPLIKRFVHTRNLIGQQPTSLNPADFNSYVPSDDTPTAPVGNRSWAAVRTTNAGLMPESWLSLVSYLYRFVAGSTRVKVFIPSNVRATVSLEMTDALQTAFDTPESDPSFVTQGAINNAVEVQIPYYSQYRARTVGDQIRGLGALARFEFSEEGNFPLYEAAGDDLSFWFMVGPPVMRPTTVDPTSIPTIQPTP